MIGSGQGKTGFLTNAAPVRSIPILSSDHSSLQGVGHAKVGFTGKPGCAGKPCAGRAEGATDLGMYGTAHRMAV